MKEFHFHRKELLEEYGDVNWQEYGGALLIQPRDGYDPYLEVIEVGLDNEGNPNGTWTIYRISIDQAEPADWFMKENRIKSVCESMDLNPTEFAKALQHSDLRIRALAYYDLVGYYGAHEFDQYPLVLSKKEFKSRYYNLLK